MNFPQCIIFDCDGVLVDSEPITFSVLAKMSREVGLALSEAELGKLFLGKSLNSIIRFLEGETGKSLIGSFEADFRQRTFARFRTDLQPVAGIKELLEWLMVPVCVASSGPPHKIRMNLEITGLTDYFGANVFSCYDLKRWKPDPAVFLHAAQTMSFTPQQCVVIEDSPVGVRGAKAGGFRTFGEGAEVIHRLEELKTRLYS